MKMNDSNDPKPLKNIIDRVIKEYGWEEEALFGRIEILWGDVVGEKVSGISSLTKFKQGCLYIETSSSTWRTELMLRRDKIIKDLNARLGEECVKELKIR